VSALHLAPKCAFAFRVFRSFALILLTTVSAFAAGKPAPRPAARPSVLHLSLHKAIELALARNFSLEVQRFNPEISKERVTQELGVFDPNFHATADFGENTTRDLFTLRNRTNNRAATDAEVKINDFSGLEHFATGSVRQDSSVTTGLDGLTSWGLQYNIGIEANHIDPLNGLGERFTAGPTVGVTQPLLRGFGTDANLSQLRIARNNVLVSEWQLRQRIIDVVTNTISAYNELQFSIQALDVATGFRDLAQQLVNDNTKRVEIGVMSPLNITTARAEAASREETVIRARRAILDNENFLKQLITNDLEGLLAIKVEIDPPPTPPFTANVPAGISQALQLRPDYRQAMLEIERRNITLSFTKNAALPRFDLSASLHYLGIDNDFGTSVNRINNRDQTVWSVGAIFSVPIPNREGRGSVAAAKLSAAQSLISLQQLEQQIVVDVDNASGAVTTARQRIESTAEASRLAKESLDAGEERLRAGTGTTFEVLELQRKLAEAEAAELRARSDYNKAVSEYHRQIGTTLQEHHVVLDAPKR
jgi:outer membrane protein TolC